MVMANIGKEGFSAVHVDLKVAFAIALKGRVGQMA